VISIRDELSVTTTGDCPTCWKTDVPLIGRPQECKVCVVRSEDLKARPVYSILLTEDEALKLAEQLLSSAGARRRNP
jgi:hypothetical protein